MSAHEAAPEIVLDLSRLVSRVLHATPTGVDRVEMAYARELLARIGDRLAFGLVHPVLGYGRVSTGAATAFLQATEQRWSAGAGVLPSNRIELVSRLSRLRPRRVPPRTGQRVLIQCSPHHLHRERLVRRILAREQAAFLVLVHDLIPIEFPEYARPGGRGTHARRIATVERLADAVVANSHATLRSFLAHAEPRGRSVLSAVSHLGADRFAASPRQAGGHPYFVSVGTIEPRKNHLLLLHVWREMAREHGPAHIPKLLLIGRRGWENEQVIDLLERCPLLVGCVEEHGGLDDAQMRDMVAGARALLLPSFAEGFGMPVPEALSLGTPVICSDLPALHEAGGDVPCYLDPLDGPAWRRAIAAFSDPHGAERSAQLARLSRWSAPSWGEHLSIVLDLAGQLARSRWAFPVMPRSVGAGR